ncbi:type VI secretion system protein TssA [Oceanimonas sp. CHS3-5]|uniref:type VI secretion system protein TssA n=1 Tax=Oceanimonas sp. CHS3-5 TaxID=3068186 RepID=UPI00273F81DF|nr:type VI secretion system protein TssA [Oceanimonas sp. CHS3-5]MDP5291714.1 type VI secretion system protein TssA [Oceanimonas sp. CHS3-5]
MTSRNALLKPIPGERPCGDDCRYEDEFELVEREIGKLNNLYHREEPDWQWVAEQTQGLLTTKTKDLRLACWLVRAWWCLEGNAGLERGCVLLAELCGTFWSGFFPRKSRARLAAIQGLIGVLDAELKDEALACPAEQLTALEAALSALDETLASLLDEPVDELTPLIRRCRQQKERQASMPATSPAPDVAAPASAKPATPAAPTVPVDLNEPVASAVASERDAARLLRQLQESARRLASFWQKDNPSDVRRFRLSRVLTWSAISALPGADNEGRTQLKPLPANKLLHYRDRLQQGDFAALLDELEVSLTRAPFWLDGHFMSWQCLNGLHCQAAADEVAHQVRHFTGAFPALLTLSFDDGTPFASPDTQDWIGSGPTPGAAPVSLPHSDMSEQHRQTIDEAMTQLGQQGLGPALQPLHQAERQAGSGRDAAKWRLAMARLCLHDQQFGAAVALLTPLYRQFDQHRLWQWEPDTGLELCQLLLAGLDKLPRKDNDPARRREVYERLCDLDVCAGLEY